VLFRALARWLRVPGPEMFQPLNPPELTLMLTLKVGQSVPLTVHPKTSEGQECQVDGTPVWDSNGTAGVSLQADLDGRTCLVTALAPGIAEIHVSADADLGEGLRAIKAGLSLRVIQPEAVELAIEAGEIQGLQTEVEA
jgi:hypothetical protein